MTIRLSWMFILVVWLAAGTSLCLTQPKVDSSIAASCKAVGTQNFSAIQDAPTQITDAQVVEAKDGDSAYCRVQGYVWPQVGFELRLPATTWNGKFIEIGCGGACGHLGWTNWCPLHRGYACIVSDMGHEGDGTLWADNNLQAQIDFAYRSTHVIALAGKAITASYYSKSPSKSMMLGCSTGGYQGMVEAQRFPWDFDGIVAIAPDMYSQGDVALRTAWRNVNLFERAGKPVFSHSDLQLLHQAALNKCDMTDGVKDGVVGDPVGCQFDPGILTCKAGQQSGCLSPRQVTAAKNIYTGPETSAGERISTRGPFPGSELNWGEADYANSWANAFFRYMFTFAAAGPGWTVFDLDFTRDNQRLGLAGIYSDNNPDLRRFKTAGGKLIVAQGGNDASEQPGAILDYYDLVERTMGGHQDTQNFLRVFLVPGINHCTGGDGAFAIDYLTSLESWVEHGQAPEKLVGAHIEGKYFEQEKTSPFELKFPLASAIPVTFTRPMFPYPMVAKYKGAGDPNKADNFEAVKP